MEFVLENELLRVTMDSHGAEVTSVVDKASGKELWWNGDPTFWAGHSPILFPACGSLWNGEYTYKGEAYKLAKHGFARRMEFCPSQAAATPINGAVSTLCGEDYHMSCRSVEFSFTLSDTEETRKSFPFAFLLTISYRLRGKSLECQAQVFNPSQEEVLYYQVGGHPAIALPDYSEGKEVAAFLRPVHESPLTMLRAGAGGCIEEERHAVPETEAGLIPVCTSTFLHDALIFDQSQVSELCVLRTDGHTEVCRVSYGAPVLLLWQMSGILCPYICVEPWYGLPDRVGHSTGIESRPYCQQAGPRATSTHHLWTIAFPE